MLSPMVPHDGSAHAGGRYLRQLSSLLESETSLTVVCAASATNRADAHRPGSPRDLMLIGLGGRRTWFGRLLDRVIVRADNTLRRWDPAMPPLALLSGIAESGRVRQAIRSADVIDLQWSECIRLVGLVRRLNPDAIITGTFHDVMSQRFSREPSATPRAARYWRLVAKRSRRHERAMVGKLDSSIVFSAKDAALLGDPVNSVVVPPPLMSGPKVRHNPSQAGIVLVVSYLARDENDKGVLWMLAEIWPRVVAEVPQARLRVVGSGASAEVRRAAADGGAELPGFVDDLDCEHREATVCLVPLRQGAGVKFKTVEALLNGVPTVSTPVGAEGIGDSGLFAAVSAEPGEIAEAVIAVLKNPGAAQPRADRAQDWAVEQFSWDRFASAIRASMAQHS